MTEVQPLKKKAVLAIRVVEAKAEITDQSVSKDVITMEVTPKILENLQGLSRVSTIC